MGTQNGGVGLQRGGQVEELATQEAEQSDVVWHWTGEGGTDGTKDTSQIAARGHLGWLSLETPALPSKPPGDLKLHTAKCH